MAAGRSQFVGAAGQYHVACGLALRQITASVTQGNAPNVDVFAASPDGRYSLTIQVKTSRNAYRRNRYGREGYEWDVGRAVIGNHSESFWYAFIDLREQVTAAGAPSWDPRIFFVPSRWVAEFVHPDWGRLMYFLPQTAEHLTLERWDVVQSYLSGEPEAIAWATNWPEHLLVKWGQPEPDARGVAAQASPLGEHTELAAALDDQLGAQAAR
jgi:hypothetical protein